MKRPNLRIGVTAKGEDFQFKVPEKNFLTKS